jgi:tRNA-specific 2-thiouridylase
MEEMEVMARIRYRQPLQAATLHQFENGMFLSASHNQLKGSLLPGI